MMLRQEKTLEPEFFSFLFSEYSKLNAISGSCELQNIPADGSSLSCQLPPWSPLQLSFLSNQANDLYQNVISDAFINNIHLYRRSGHIGWIPLRQRSGAILRYSIRLIIKTMDALCAENILGK